MSYLVSWSLQGMGWLGSLPFSLSLSLSLSHSCDLQFDPYEPPIWQSFGLCSAWKTWECLPKLIVKLALEWVPDMPMLAELNDHETQGVLALGMMRGFSLVHGLALLPWKIWAVPPPRIVELEEWSLCLLPIVVESVHLFHRALNKSRWRWTTLC